MPAVAAVGSTQTAPFTPCRSCNVGSYNGNKLNLSAPASGNMPGLSSAENAYGCCSSPGIARGGG
jgi:hypothetical protein